MTIADFLRDRIGEKRRAAQATVDQARGAARRNGKSAALRQLRECEAMLRIVELHEAWPVLIQSPPRPPIDPPTDPASLTFRATQQIAWATQQQYRATFGTEPPTAPMLAELAAIWCDHPDYDHEWAI